MRRKIQFTQNHSHKGRFYPNGKRESFPVDETEFLVGKGYAQYVSQAPDGSVAQQRDSEEAAAAALKAQTVSISKADADGSVTEELVLSLEEARAQGYLPAEDEAVDQAAENQAAQTSATQSAPAQSERAKKQRGGE